MAAVSPPLSLPKNSHAFLPMTGPLMAELFLGSPGTYLSTWTLTVPSIVDVPMHGSSRTSGPSLSSRSSAAKIDEDQLHGHARSAGWPRGSYDLCYLTWQEIYTIFHDELAKQGNHSPTNRLLVGQWLDYLGGQQMIPFEKVESDDFDYFTLSEDDQRPTMAQPSEARRIPGTARENGASGAHPELLWTACLRMMPGSTGPAEEANVRSGSTWEARDTARNWHVTVYFRPHGVDVEVLGAQQGLDAPVGQGGQRNCSQVGATMLRGFGTRVNRCRLPEGLVREPGVGLQGSTDRPRGCTSHGAPEFLG